MLCFLHITQSASSCYCCCCINQTLWAWRALAMRRRGTNLAVPADLEGTLAMRYGPDWRTPAYMSKGADTGDWGGCGTV